MQPMSYRAAQHVCAIGLVSVLAGLTACRIRPAQTLTKADASQTCHTAGTSFGIVDGQTTGDFSPVYMLLVLDANSGQMSESCTGTFVGDNVLVTAAHCIPASPSNLVLTSNQQSIPKLSQTPLPGVRAVQTFTDASIALGSHGTYEPTQSQDFSLDFAVVLFPSGTASSNYNVAKRTAPSGTAVTLVGYGAQDIYGDLSSGSSINKFKGSNTIATPNTKYPSQGLYQTFAWGHPGEAAAHGQSTSSNAPGDSGGPLLDSAQTLLGTVKFGFGTREVADIQSSIGTDTLDFFVDITNATATALLAEAAAAGAHIHYADGSQSSQGACNPANPSPSGSSPQSPATNPNPAGGSGGKWCDPNNGSACYPYCTNGSNTGNHFGWQPDLGGPNGGSCRVPGS